jgi:hypothetical protein
MAGATDQTSTSWRADVEMPPAVAALPQTQAGIPITYTVAWTSERGTVIRPDPIMEPLVAPGTPAIFATGRRGVGQPMLNVSDTSRQRACNVQGRCQVCGRRLDDGPRWIADLRNRGQEIDLGGQRRPLLVDSWTHQDCLHYALRVCPGLARRRPAIFHVRDWRLIATLERPDSIPHEQLPDGAIGWVKVAPIDYDEYVLEDALHVTRIQSPERSTNAPASAPLGETRNTTDDPR